MDTARKTCMECGDELADDAARGLCPRCLLQAGLKSQTDPNATVAGGGGAGQRRSLPNVGERFGLYRMIRLLGRGGMGVVYEAEEIETGRRVALKVLGRQFDSAKDRARFLREGRLAASINHPNSVYVFGTEEIEGSPTIAMELVSGGTLAERLSSRGPMSVPEAVDAILQIIAGLEAAQAIGILHRDVKPGNCFEDSDSTIKIGDFGLSISTAARAETNITADGAMVGTPAFCSPEQLRGEELNARSDMYSVGGTLFFLLTGRVPFEGQNIVQLTANVLEKPSPSPRGFRREIPKGLASVVLRCLAKQPTNRFKSYDDLRQALAPYGSTAPTPATLSLRFLAGLIDNLTVGLVGTAIVWLWFGNPMGWLATAGERSLDVRLLLVFGQFAAVLVYYTLFEGLWGAAVGKAVCRLRIVGPDENPPGFSRALLRALLYLVLPSLPYIVAYRGDPKAAMTGSMVLQQLIGLSHYVILALLFCTARRRNGFAAVQDLVTSTRVISRAALEMRPLLSAVETPPTAVDAKPSIGPYHVLETLEAGADGEWLLGYDVRLLRKVWIRTVPPGTPPIATALRSIGRIGRLRWLAGRRSPEENWDAFEAISGQPLVRLIQEPWQATAEGNGPEASKGTVPFSLTRKLGQSPGVKTGKVPQPWRQVRFWLYDLAAEIAAAEKDGTLPETLSLDRVWITGDGRAKLLDFRPGLVPTAKGDSPIFVDTKIGTVPMPVATVPARGQRFLAEVAVAALEGRSEGAEKPAGEAAIPLPLHARRFLNDLPRHACVGSVAAALRPLLRRTTAVSRLRRATVVAACGAFPVLASCFLIVSMAMMHQLAPDIMNLFGLLQQRQIKNLIAEKNKGTEDGHKEKTPTDRQFAVFIASHYRTTIADKTIWESPIALALIKDDYRQFAERSIAEHPAPTKEEIIAADAALEPCLHDIETSKLRPLVVIMACLAVYVCLPALIAAAAFRGGLILWVAGVTFVRRDGKRASRLRVFWRAIVAWSPLCVAVPLVIASLDKQAPVASSDLPIALALGVLLVLAIVSVVLPKRGLADRLAGTWPVPR